MKAADLDQHHVWWFIDQDDVERSTVLLEAGPIGTPVKIIFTRNVETAKRWVRDAKRGELPHIDRPPPILDTADAPWRYDPAYDHYAR
jgi:hypothetical protein